LVPLDTPAFGLWLQKKTKESLGCFIRPCFLGSSSGGCTKPSTEAANRLKSQQIAACSIKLVALILGNLASHLEKCYTRNNE